MRSFFFIILFFRVVGLEEVGKGGNRSFEYIKGVCSVTLMAGNIPSVFKRLSRVAGGQKLFCSGDMENMLC